MGKFNKRDKFSGRGGDKPNRQMHQATCAECGRGCEVPFRPTGDKAVFCSDCFSKKDGSNNKFDRRESSRSDFGDKQMFQAVCDECHKKCEVPFKPSSGKPIFCNDCFSEKGSRRGNSAGPDQYKKQFEMLNDKLDNILKMLSSGNSTPKTTKQEIVKKEAVKTDEKKIKKEAVKKVAPKKVVAPKKEAKKKAVKKKK